MKDRHRDVALFRYSLIREAADPALTKAERGTLVRSVAARDHTGPQGARVRVARNTVDRWIRAWRAGGFEALMPAVRTAEPTTPAAVLDLAVKLKREAPGRTAAQVAAIIIAAEGKGPSQRTIQRLFARLGLNTRPDGTPTRSVRPFRGRRPQRPLDGRRPARPARRGPQGLPIRVHRRPQPCSHRLSVGAFRRHRPPGSSVASRSRRPRHSPLGLR